MINLMLKDIFSQKKDFILLLILFIVFIFVFRHNTLAKITSIISFLLILNGFLNSYCNDISNKHHVLINSLPITRKEIVISKYVFSIFYAFLLLSITVLCIKIINFLNPSLDLSLFTFRNMLTLFLFYLLLATIIFPICYEIQNKTLITIFTSTLASLIAMYNCSTNDSTNDCLSNIIYSISENIMVSCLLIIILYIVSMFLSIYIYESKDLI